MKILASENSPPQLLKKQEINIIQNIITKHLYIILYIIKKSFVYFKNKIFIYENNYKQNLPACQHYIICFIKFIVTSINSNNQNYNRLTTARESVERLN